MALYKGSNKICDLYYHGVAVAEIYKGNILVWTKAAAEYLVTVSQAANGTITAAPMQGPAGTLVTLSNTPNAGYQLTYYTVNGNQIQGNTFTLDSDSTISGLFTAVTYTVTIGAHANGSLSANPMSGVYGTTVTLTGTPNSHYVLDYYSVNGSRITGNTFTLTQDSTVAATFKQATYTVTIGTHTNGTLSASPASGVYGTTITLSGTPNSGYTLDYYTVGGSRITGNTFTLTGNTTVTAVYKSAAIQLLYLNKMNDTNLSATKNDVSMPNFLHSYAPTITTISAVDGRMPSSYIGQSFAKFKDAYTSSSFAFGSDSLTQFTIGFWFKNSSNQSMYYNRNRDNRIGPGAILEAPATDTSIYIGTTTVPMMSTSYVTITPANGTTYITTSSANMYKTPNVNGNKWCYIAIVCDKTNTSQPVRWYVNGTMYLSIAPRSTSYDLFKYSNSYSVYKSLFYYLAGNASRSKDYSSSISEIAIYPGIVTAIPTAPLVPA